MSRYFLFSAVLSLAVGSLLGLYLALGFGGLVSINNFPRLLDLDFALLRDGASDGQLASGAYSKKALDFACFFEPVSHVL